MAASPLRFSCQEAFFFRLSAVFFFFWQEGEYETARAKFVEAMNQLGYQPDLAYSQALCLYKTQQYELAVRMLEEIIQRGVRDHPGLKNALMCPSFGVSLFCSELSVFSNTDGVDVRSVGNSGVLKETALIEAFNLKAAVEFQVKNCAIFSHVFYIVLFALQWTSEYQSALLFVCCFQTKRHAWRSVTCRRVPKKSWTW